MVVEQLCNEKQRPEVWKQTAVVGNILVSLERCQGRSDPKLELERLWLVGSQNEWLRRFGEEVSTAPLSILDGF